ncbi:PAS domain-containing protein [Massilia consociata]|uniref:PAS domain-containing protein n=1 Tax=Massilia consociata TaxID=760117 RepID=A0ABV6FEB6_9BURK
MTSSCSRVNINFLKSTKYPPSADTNDAHRPLSFASADLAAQLDDCTTEQLDQLDFGVIAFDADTKVQRYNAFESQAAGLSTQRVLGEPLFTNVAPCLNNFMVAQRFEDAQEEGSALDATIDYVLTLRMRPVKVALRLLASPAGRHRYVLVQRQPR